MESSRTKPETTSSAGGDATIGDQPVRVMRQGRPLWLLAAVGLAAVTLVAVLTNQPATERATTPAETPGSQALSPSTIVNPPSQPEASVDAALNPLDAVPELPLAISVDSLVQAVVGSPIGQEPRLLEWMGGGITVDRELPQLREFSYDLSGKWLAARDRPLGILNSANGLVGDLWIGPANGELVLVAEDVLSFAWHDSESAKVAWHADANLNRERLILTAEVGMRADGEVVVSTQISTDSPGVLERWGSWGFALDVPRPSREVVLIDPEGVELAAVPGSANGTIDGLVLISGFGSKPGLFDPATGLLIDVPWLDEDVRVWQMAVSPVDPSLIAFQLSRNDFGGLGSGRVVLLDIHESVEPLKLLELPAPGPTDIAWDPNGQFFVFATQGALSDVTALSAVTVGFTDGLLVVSTLETGEWVQALSVG